MLLDWRARVGGRSNSTLADAPEECWIKLIEMGWRRKSWPTRMVKDRRGTLGAVCYREMER